MAVVLVVGEKAVGTAYNDNYEVPGSESQDAIDRLQADFPAYAGSTNNQVVLHATTGTLADPTYQAAIQSSLAAVAQAPDVVGVSPPVISSDQTIGYASVA